MRKTLCRISSVVALLPAAAHSQTAAAPAPADTAEIIVTATKRSESIQTVPLSISAIGGEELTQNQSTTLSDILQGTPGVAVANLGGEGTNIIIRGVSSAPDGEGGGTGTAVYFGDVPIGGQSAAGFGSPNLRAVDMQRVEVLRGPQGTLYGAGALSGAVRYIPNSPDSTRIAAGFNGSVFDRAEASKLGYSLEGFVNVPLARDLAALRFVGYREDTPGFVNNTRLGRDVGGAKITGGRASIGITPSTSTTIDLSYAYQKRTADGRPEYDANLSGFQIARRAEPQSREYNLGSATLKHGFGSVELTSISAYQDDRTRNRFDESTLGRLDEFSQTTKRFTEELRLASEGGSRLGWIVGGFYERYDQTRTNAFFDLTTLLPRNTSRGAVLDFDVDFRQYAAFGEFYFDLTQALRLTLGGRYADYKIDSSTFRSSVDPANASALLPRVNVRTQSLSDHTFNPRLNLSFRPDRDSMYYAEIQKGFRPGSTTAPLAQGCSLFGQVSDTFKSDSVWNFEGGTKQTFGGGRATLRAAAYYQTWKNIPLFLADPTCFQFFINNAAKARAVGAEVEMSARIADGLRLGASVAYNNSKFLNVTGAGAAAIPGEKTVFSPTWTLNGTLDYERRFSSNATAFIGLNVNYISKYKNDVSCDFNGFAAFLPLNSKYTVLPGLQGCYDSGATPPSFVVDPGSGNYATVNGRVGVRLAEKTSLYVFARNLFNNDKRTFINYFALDDRLDYVRNPPRVVGLAVDFTY